MTSTLWRACARGWRLSVVTLAAGTATLALDTESLLTSFWVLVWVFLTSKGTLVGALGAPGAPVSTCGWGTTLTLPSGQQERSETFTVPTVTGLVLVETLVLDASRCRLAVLLGAPAGRALRFPEPGSVGHSVLSAAATERIWAGVLVIMAARRVWAGALGVEVAERSWDGVLHTVAAACVV